jgi:signal transduction histidine kinase
VFGALGRTLQLLARRLEGLLDDEPPDRARQELRRLRALTDEVLEMLGCVTTAEHHRAGRRPSLGVGVALRRLGADFARATGTAVDVRVPKAVEDLDDDVVEVIFGVAREAFLNIERHGRATIVVVTLALRDSSVVLDVKDDGLDLAQREAYDWHNGTKRGLLTVAELVSSVGGRAALTATPPRGIRLVVEIPRVPAPV